MIFSTLKGLTIPEGIVKQITDTQGRILWVCSGKVVLEVEKIISNTYANETQYPNEEFVLLDIYPKTNGTVKVTYGNLTKTITETSGAEEPNASQVFFGTFRGMPDDVETPISGTLTIEGDYYAFGCGVYRTFGKGDASYFTGITAVTRWGDINMIPDYAFYSGSSENYVKITCAEIPEGVTSIGNYAFNNCTGLLNVTIPSSVKTIGISAYGYCTSLTSVIIRATNPPTLVIENSVASTFEDSTCPIVVPKGCSDVYKTAEGWSSYADRIMEES